jgi:hypothetical protein
MNLGTYDSRTEPLTESSSTAKDKGFRSRMKDLSRRKFFSLVYLIFIINPKLNLRN